jgi:hypothetical protein
MSNGDGVHGQSPNRDCNWSMVATKGGEGEVADRWKKPVLTIYGKAVHHRLQAKRILCARADVKERQSGAHERRGVAFFQNDAVVALVSGDNEGQGEHGNLLLAGDAALQPGIIIERTD